LRFRYRTTAARENSKKLIKNNAPEQLKIGKHFTRAKNDRGERIFRYGNGQAGFFANPMIEVL
jgi:hypothetical protein